GTGADRLDPFQAYGVLAGLHVVVVPDLDHVRAGFADVECEGAAGPEAGDPLAGRGGDIDVGRKPGQGGGAGGNQRDPVAGRCGEGPLVLLRAGGDGPGDNAALDQRPGTGADRLDAFEADRVHPGLGVVVVPDLDQVIARFVQVEREGTTGPEAGDALARRG